MEGYKDTNYICKNVDIRELYHLNDHLLKNSWK